jgi:hypothetical protein
MAVLTFPLSLATFWLRLPIARETFEIASAVETSRTRGGEILTADLGASLWSGKIELGPMTQAEARAITPLLNILRSAKGSIMVADSARLRPALDPTGSILGASAPTVLATGTTWRELSLTGLPPGYVLSPGDRITWAEAGRWHLHEIVQGVTADAGGVTPMIEVTPPLRVAPTPGVSVLLTNPRCRAVVDPASIELGQTRQTIVTGVKFAWTQTLRTT